MNFNRSLPFFISVLNYIFLQIYFFWPSLIYIALVLQIISYLFAIRQFITAGGGNREVRWYYYLIWPLNFSIGLTAFSILIPSAYMLQILFFAYFLISYYYLKIIYRQLRSAGDFDKPGFENFSSYANFISFYFIASAIYGLQTFLGINISYLIFAVIIFTCLTIVQVFWANNIEIKKNLHFLLIIILVLTEIAWSASFLTLSFYILGLILAVSYYILIGIARFYIRGTLDAKLVKLYLVFGFSSLLLVLFTTKWISSN